MGSVYGQYEAFVQLVRGPRTDSVDPSLQSKRERSECGIPSDEGAWKDLG